MIFVECERGLQDAPATGSVAVNAFQLSMHKSAAPGLSLGVQESTEIQSLLPCTQPHGGLAAANNFTMQLQEGGAQGSRGFRLGRTALSSRLLVGSY
jgi:hypothetical protein